MFQKRRAHLNPTIQITRKAQSTMKSKQASAARKTKKVRATVSTKKASRKTAQAGARSSKKGAVRKVASKRNRPIADWSKTARTRLDEILILLEDSAGELQKAFKPFHRGEWWTPPWLMSVEVVGGAQIRRLNRIHREKDKETDVLSFPTPPDFRHLQSSLLDRLGGALRETAREQGLGVRLGDIVICRPVLERQALEVGHSVAEELDVLLIHGALHLLGVDHERSSREAQVMGEWEERLLKKLWASTEDKESRSDKAQAKAQGQRKGRTVWNRGLIQRTHSATA